MGISFFNFQFGTTKKADFSKLQYLALSENEVPAQCLRKCRSLKQTAVSKNFAILKNCISFPEVACEGVKKYLVSFGIFLQMRHLVTVILQRNDGLTTVC